MFFEAIMSEIVSLITFSACFLLVYRKGDDFICCSFAKSVHKCKDLFYLSLYFLFCTISYCLQIRLMSIFPICFFHISVSYIAVVKSSNTILKKSGESGYSCLISNFTRNVFAFFCFLFRPITIPA